MTLGELRTILDNTHRADALVAGLSTDDGATYEVGGLELEVHEGGSATLWLKLSVN